MYIFLIVFSIYIFATLSGYNKLNSNDVILGNMGIWEKSQSPDYVEQPENETPPPTPQPTPLPVGGVKRSRSF